MVEMENPRLFYRAILKLFALFGILAMLYVLFSSLFTDQGGVQKKEEERSKINDIVTLDLNEIRQGMVRKIRWNGKEVVVLKYSASSDYSVFFNTGDSGNCPLFYSSNTFKDTCTGTLYDHTGHDENKKSPKVLAKPPYHIKEAVLFIGE